MWRLMLIIGLILILTPHAMAGEVREIIITPEKLKIQALDLQNLHRSLGIQSEVVTVEQIWEKWPEAEDPPVRGYATGDLRYDLPLYNYTLARKIVTYLRNCDANYITILGDAELVPPSYYAASHYSYPIPTDYYYSDPDYDGYAELAIGRIPASTPEEAEKIVEKIRTWYSELTPERFRKALIVGTKIYASQGYRSGNFVIEDVETWQGELAAVEAAEKLVGFTPELHLQSDDGGRIKGALDGAFSGGYGLVVHFGHGTPHSLDYGGRSYTTYDLRKVAKVRHLLPIVVSGGCGVAAYDEEIDSEVRSRFGQFVETLLFSDAGGIAFVGSTDIATTDFWYEDGYTQNGFVEFGDVRWADHILLSVLEGLGSGKRLGDVLRDALNEYSDNDLAKSGAFGQDALLEMILLGDPTLELPQLGNNGTSSPEVDVLSTPVSFKEPCKVFNGHRFCDGRIPVFKGKVHFHFSETVNVKIFDLAERAVPLILKKTEVDRFTFSPPKTGKYLLRASNDRMETWYAFYAEPDDLPEIELVYPKHGATGVELNPLLKVRVSGDASNYTVEFYAKSGELIGSSEVENGYATVRWGDLSEGKVYEWYVILKWDGGSETSDIYRFKTSSAPVAEFEYSANGNLVSFTSTSSDPDGQPLTCLWNFGDDGGAEGCEVQYAFEPGNHEVTLTVTDTTGLSDSVTKIVVVSNTSVSNTSQFQVELPLGSKDLDGDGLYEDINGDGVLDYKDISCMQRNYRNPEFQSYVRYYDFYPDCKIDTKDVIRLYVYWKWGYKYWERCRELGRCEGCP